MQHLFGNVYLTLDSSFDQTVPCVILSPIIDTLPGEGFEAKIARADLARVLWEGSDYTAFPSATVFATLVEQSANRVLVHVSSDMYPRFLAQWFKTAFPNMSTKAGELLMMSLAFSRLAFGHPFAQRHRITPATAKQYKRMFSEHTVVEMQELYDNVAPFDVDAAVLSTIRSKLGIESVVAQHFIEPTPVTRSRIVDMAQRLMLDVLMDRVRYVAAHPTLLPEFDPLQQSVEEWVQEHPEYALIGDQRVKSGGDLAYALDTYGASVLHQMSITVGEWIGEPAMFTFREISADEVIDMEMSTPLYSPLIAAGRRDSLINSLLLYRLYQEHRDGADAFARQLIT